VGFAVNDIPLNDIVVAGGGGGGSYFSSDHGGAATFSGTANSGTGGYGINQAIISPISLCFNSEYLYILDNIQQKVYELQIRSAFQKTHEQIESLCLLIKFTFSSFTYGMPTTFDSTGNIYITETVPGQSMLGIYQIPYNSDLHSLIKPSTNIGFLYDRLGDMITDSNNDLYMTDHFNKLFKLFVSNPTRRTILTDTSQNQLGASYLAYDKIRNRLYFSDGTKIQYLMPKLSDTNLGSFSRTVNIDNVNHDINDLYTITAFVNNSGTTGSISDNISATDATTNTIQAMCVDRYGNLYFADTGNHAIRMVCVDPSRTYYGRTMNPNNIIIYIYTIAGGNGAGFAGDGEHITNSDGTINQGIKLNHPSGVAVDQHMCLYILRFF
jgi:hypothetical protein